MARLRTFIEFVHSAEIIPHEQLFPWYFSYYCAQTNLKMIIFVTKLRK